MKLRRFRVLHNNIYDLGVPEAKRRYWTEWGARRVAKRLNEDACLTGIWWDVTDLSGTPITYKRRLGLE